MIFYRSPTLFPEVNIWTERPTSEWKHGIRHFESWIIGDFSALEINIAGYFCIIQYLNIVFNVFEWNFKCFQGLIVSHSFLTGMGVSESTTDDFSKWRRPSRSFLVSRSFTRRFVEMVCGYYFFSRKWFLRCFRHFFDGKSHCKDKVTFYRKKDGISRS